MKYGRFVKDLFSQMTQCEQFCDELFSRIEKTKKIAWLYFHESAKMWKLSRDFSVTILQEPERFFGTIWGANCNLCSSQDYW